MVSIWLVVSVLLVFLIGGYAVNMVFARIGITAREGERAVKADEAAQRDGLGPVNLDERWRGL